MSNENEQVICLNMYLTFVQNIGMFKINEQMEIMNMQTREQEILERALEVFQRETNTQVDVEPFDFHKEKNGADATFGIQLHDGKTKKFLVQVKRTLTDAILTRFAREHGDNLEKWIIVTNYVHRKIAKTMHGLGMQFIDIAGNAHINRPPIIIFLHGYPKQEYAYEETGGVIFGPAGLKVLFALLCKPELLNQNYREIKSATNVALGTVARTMKDLVKHGYLIEMKNKEKKLIRRKELLDKWTDAYAVKIRPKNIIGRYLGANPNFWQQADLTPFNALWGGETAAYLLTQYLKPEIATIYAQRAVNDLILHYKLRRKQEGHVEIRRRFWNFNTVEENRNVVPPLLIYADLVATGIARNIETAKMIYDNHLKKYIGED